MGCNRWVDFDLDGSYLVQVKCDFSPEKIVSLTSRMEKCIAEGRLDPSAMQPPPYGRMNFKAFSYIFRARKCSPGESGQPPSSGLRESESPSS
eukprot:jgi/Botrbrau1/13802/Bobra.0056s0050.1